MEHLSVRFNQYMVDEYSQFAKVENKRSNRPDLHAFLLLDELVPGKTDMVSCAEHDEIWLEVEPDELEKVVTDEQILELVRCGVSYDDMTDSLHMFA